jgi:hypothetical protein
MFLDSLSNQSFLCSKLLIRIGFTIPMFFVGAGLSNHVWVV